MTQILNREEVVKLRDVAATNEFSDGQKTAGKFVRGIKSNLQLNPLDPGAKAVTEIVLGALRRNTEFQDLVLPRNILPVMLNLYEAGMAYGLHVDDPIMRRAQHLVRTDLSMTIFLNDPDAYDGGELLVQMPSGDEEIKLPAGDAVVYSTTHLHRVAPVTRGSRLAAVTWIQSMIRTEADRSMIRDLRAAMDIVAEKAPASEELRLLMLTYSNLIRRLAEV